MQPEKEPSKQHTPIEQWDQIAFHLIYQELAPTGFKKQKNGKYRGTEYVEVPKKAVIRTQKITAQLVRGFRDNVKKEFERMINESELAKHKVVKDLTETGWYKIKAKRHLQDVAVSFEQEINLLKKVINILENISIK